MTVYQFQQAEWGDLWAMPVEPVHPNTRGLFWEVNELGGRSLSPSDSCWCGYPVQNLANCYFEYVDGATGTYYRVKVNDVLDAAVGLGNNADKPVPVPMDMIVSPISDWQDEREMAEEGGYPLSDSWKNDRENCAPPPPEG